MPLLAFAVTVLAVYLLVGVAWCVVAFVLLRGKGEDIPQRTLRLLAIIPFWPGFLWLAFHSTKKAMLKLEVDA